RFNTSITHAYSIVIGSKHITLNATGGGFLTASKQFRHGATSKSRSNTASNSTKHKSPHLSGWRDRKSGSAGMPRPISYAVFCLKKKRYKTNSTSFSFLTTERWIFTYVFLTHFSIIVHPLST